MKMDLKCSKAEHAQHWRKEHYSHNNVSIQAKEGGFALFIVFQQFLCQLREESFLCWLLLLGYRNSLYDLCEPKEATLLGYQLV